MTAGLRYHVPAMPETIRSYDADDQSGVLKLLVSAMPADSICESRFVRQVLLDANFRPEGLPVAVNNGNVVGFCLAIARHVPLENAPSDADRGYITLFAVAPDSQRRGVGAKLFAVAEDYLKSQDRSACMVSSYAPG